MTTTSLYVSSTGASARLAELETVANNLANANTTGFRSDEPTFEARLEAVLQDATGREVPGTPIHSFVQTGSAGTRHLEGPVTRTGGSLDVAIDGPGFFEVETPEGTRFTRAGSFHVGRDGTLVTASGQAVLGTGGPLSVGKRGGRILADGNLVDTEGKTLGRLAVQEFDEPKRLVKEGGSLFRAPEGAERSVPIALRLMPGALEGSNVQPAAELAQLVALQRAYDASMQALEADDSAARRLIQEVSR